MGRLELHDADDRVTGVVRVMQGAVATFPFSPEWEIELRSMMVIDPRTGQQVTPSDGDRWLFGLQRNYRGIYDRGVFVPE